MTGRPNRAEEIEQVASSRARPSACRSTRRGPSPRATPGRRGIGAAGRRSTPGRSDRPRRSAAGRRRGPAAAARTACALPRAGSPKMAIAAEATAACPRRRELADEVRVGNLRDVEVERPEVGVDVEGPGRQRRAVSGRSVRRPGRTAGRHCRPGSRAWRRPDHRRQEHGADRRCRGTSRTARPEQDAARDRSSARPSRSPGNGPARWSRGGGAGTGRRPPGRRRCARSARRGARPGSRARPSRRRSRWPTPVRPIGTSSGRPAAAIARRTSRTASGRRCRGHPSHRADSRRRRRVGLVTRRAASPVRRGPIDGDGREAVRRVGRRLDGEAIAGRAVGPRGEERRRQRQADPVRRRAPTRAASSGAPAVAAVPCAGPNDGVDVDEPAAAAARRARHLAKPAATDDRPAFDDPLAVDRRRARRACSTAPQAWFGMIRTRSPIRQPGSAAPGGSSMTPCSSVARMIARSGRSLRPAPRPPAVVLAGERLDPRVEDVAIGPRVADDGGHAPSARSPRASRARGSPA